jgi:hypothetical protein
MLSLNSEEYNAILGNVQLFKCDVIFDMSLFD